MSIIPLFRTSPVQEAEFSCEPCGRREVYPSHARPICLSCQTPMPIARPLFRGADPKLLSIDKIEMSRAQTAEWEAIHKVLFAENKEKTFPDWKNFYEIWALRPGRNKGEKIGWMGDGTFGWHYYLVSGYPEREGFAPTWSDALGKVILVLEG